MNPENIEGQGFHTDPSRINKEGRPKGSKNLSTILREMLQEEVEVDVNGKKEKKTLSDVLVRKLIQKANKGEGDIRAIAEIFDRTEGKAPQEIKQENYNVNVEPTPEEAQRIKESLNKLI